MMARSHHVSLHHIESGKALQISWLHYSYHLCIEVCSWSGCDGCKHTRMSIHCCQPQKRHSMLLKSAVDINSYPQHFSYCLGQVAIANDREHTKRNRVNKLVAVASRYSQSEYTATHHTMQSAMYSLIWKQDKADIHHKKVFDIIIWQNRSIFMNTCCDSKLPELQHPDVAIYKHQHLM